MKKILKKAWRNLENQDWSEMRRFRREKERAIEREIERNEGQITRGSLNRSSVNLDRWRCREVLRQLSRKVSRKRSSTDIGIEEVSRNNPSNARIEAWLIHQLPKSYRGGRSFLDLFTRYREAVDIAIRKKPKKLNRQQGIEEVSS